MFFHTVYKSGQIFLPFCHKSRVWQTDRRTNRRTDRIFIARPRLHCMQRGKNYAPFWFPTSSAPLDPPHNRMLKCAHSSAFMVGLQFWQFCEPTYLQTQKSCCRCVKRSWQFLHQLATTLGAGTADSKLSSVSCNTRCSAIAERPRCRVRYSFRQKQKTGTGRLYFTDIIGLSSTTVI